MLEMLKKFRESNISKLSQEEDMNYLLPEETQVSGRPSVLKFFNDIVKHKPKRIGMDNPHYVKIPENNYSKRISILQTKLA